MAGWHYADGWIPGPQRSRASNEPSLYILTYGTGYMQPDPSDPESKIHKNDPLSLFKAYHDLINLIMENLYWFF
jgi:hypothetical protein